MKCLSSFLGLALPITTSFGLALPTLAQTDSSPFKSDAAPSEVLACPFIEEATPYDVIVFGDEVPGVMTALKVKRELRLRGESSRVALITEGNIDNGIGGHLVRGGLAYLDRNQVPIDKRSKYGVFGRPSRLYQEFLGLGRVKTIALDRFTIAQGFSHTLHRHLIDVIGNVELQSANSVGNVVCSLTASGQTYTATHFVDASQSGELAEASGVAMMQGLEALGFPDSTLSIGLIFELYGINIEQLKAMEVELIERFTDPNDTEAQKWLLIACGSNPAKSHDLVQTLIDKSSDPKLLYTGTEDSADVRSLAFSIAMHGRLGREYDLKSSGFLFDRANIAVLPNRLSFNALLFYATAEQARQLSTSGAKPTAEMLEITTQIKAMFERLGTTRVEVMDELYVRNAGQIANPIDELSATLMTAGGIPASEALGTFGYHLDDRGGIDGLDEQIQQSSLRSLNFRQLPIFNYGFRHTLPTERQNLAVLGPASGFGGLGTTAGRIVELNVGVGEGLAIAISKAISEKRSLHTIQNIEVRESMGYTPAIYGKKTASFRAILSLERKFRAIDYKKDYLKKAQSFIEKGNYAEATQVLSRAITIDARDADAYYLRGNALNSLTLYDLAREDYSEALRLNPALAEASIKRGYLHFFTSNYNQAIKDFDQALQSDAGWQEAQLGKALATSFQQSMLTGNTWYTEALPILNTTIKKQPDLAVAYVIRGVAQEKLGKREQSLSDLKTAAALYESQGDQISVNSTEGMIKTLQN